MSSTENPKSVVDAEAFSVRRSIRIEASRERVWAAVTEPEQISLWFGRADFDGSGPGATGTLSWDDYGDVPVRVEAVDAPRSITYRWSNYDEPELPARVVEEHSTVFTFTLEVLEEGVATRLTVVETGFETVPDAAANLDSHRDGWDSELDELTELVER
jgi:uncharacterized protein YndB with AHSA1/START domain